MTLKRLLAGGVLVGVLTVGPATPVFAGTTVSSVVENVTDAGDDGSDKTGLWGLLGLAGLAGLAGLKRPKRNVETTTYGTGAGSSTAR